MVPELVTTLQSAAKNFSQQLGNFCSTKARKSDKRSALVQRTENLQGTVETGWSLLNCWTKRAAYKLLWSVRFGGYFFLMKMDAVFRLELENSLCPTFFNDLLMAPAENPTVLNKEEDKVNSPPTISVSLWLTQPPKLLRSHLWKKNWKMTKSVYWSPLKKYYAL